MEEKKWQESGWNVWKIGENVVYLQIVIEFFDMLANEMSHRSLLLED